MPPCAQMEISPNCTSRRRISLRERGHQPGAGGPERMSDRDGAAHHVGAIPVHLADRSRQAQPLGPGLRAPGLHVGEHLRGEGLVDLDQAQVAPGDAGALERARHRVDRTHEELPARIHRRYRVAPEVRERLVSRARRPFPPP